MRLSNRTIYGLRAVVDLAYHGNGEPMRVSRIADRCAIPGRFLEQILQELKKAELVESKRGPGGGYRLVAPADEITLAAVLEILDDLPRLPDVVSDGEIKTAAQIADAACGEVVEHMVELLANVTVADLVARGEKLGLARQGYEGFVYVI